ncbi:E3 ubiquitin-protein ligase TRIM31 [Loxodonta africana]|uniref:E3 ubiquitin-protein ligase TRIM31 n=1 Tax=Loxodonta africana TaxID=9785 RepID=UPI0030D2F226
MPDPESELGRSLSGTQRRLRGRYRDLTALFAVSWSPRVSTPPPPRPSVSTEFRSELQMPHLCQLPLNLSQRSHLLLQSTDGKPKPIALKGGPQRPLRVVAHSKYSQRNLPADLVRLRTDRKKPSCFIMASPQFVSNLQEEVICPICIDILQDAVTIDCGHSFCLSLCRDSQDHKSHKANLIEEAAPKYQGLIQLQLKDLQQKEKMIVQVKAQGERKIDVFKAQVEHEKQRIIREFKHLRQVLEEEEKFLLLRLDWLAQEGENGSHFFGNSTEAQLNSLNRLVDLLKAKQQMSPREMLSGIKVVLYRSRGFQFLQPTAVSPDLEKKLSEAKSRHDSITETLKKFRGTNSEKEGEGPRIYSLGTRKAETGEKASVRPHPEGAQRLVAGQIDPQLSLFFLPSHAVPVTLDAASAHPDLVLSPDLKTVALDFVPPGDSEEPAHPECFYPLRCVLGSPGFSSGRQAWEVELGGAGGGACVVGVASEHAGRRGFLAVEPRAGFWALRIAGSECQALIEANTREELPARTNRVGVCVDHERGEVVFYDAITSQHIYTFQACFPGRIFPFFRLLFPGTKITLSP